MTTPDQAAHRLTLAAALGGAVMISFAAIFFALSEASPTTGAFFRALYALPVLGLLWWWRRSRDHRPLRARWMAVGAGLALGLDFLGWHSAIELIGTGLATLLVNTAVVFVALGAWLVLGERPARTTLVAIPVILLGVALVSGVGQGDAFGIDPVRGTLFALGAAIAYSIYLLTLRHANASLAPSAGPLLEATIGTAVITLAIGLIGGDIDLAITFPSHFWLISLAVGGQVIGWLLILYALPRLPAAEAATIILVQPAMTMLWGALIFDERPSVMQIGGAAVVLSGVGLLVAARARRERATNAG